MNSLLVNETGRKIVTDNPNNVCFKCGKEIKENTWAFYCEINKKIFCENPECKSKSCPYEYVRDYHEDHYAPLTFIVKKNK